MFDRIRRLAACWALAAVAAAASGQTPPAAGEPAPPAERSRATTADLALAYIELERAFFAAPVDRDLCREVNTAFDEATLLFFSGNLGRVVEKVEAQTARLMKANNLEAGVLHPPRGARARDGAPRTRDEPGAPIDPRALLGTDADEALLQKVRWPGRSEAVWRERRSLLHRVESAGSMESLLFDAPDLRADLIGEYRAAAAGENPYANRRGDLWRPFFVGDEPAPMRLFCPEHRGAPAAGWPLVVALHGAGGNEHMFFAAYGAGRIKQLAERHGFVVACPQNSPLAAQPAIFDALVESIGADYPIDRSRVYLIGHSMGAAVSLAWGRARHDKVAACALVAGAGRVSPRDRLPPALVVAAELDGLIPARSIIDNAERAAAAGLTIETREVKDYGHTLVVGHVLPEVVEWLLKHARKDQPPVPHAPARIEQGASP